MDDKMLEMFHLDNEIHENAIRHSRLKGYEREEINLFFQPEFWDIMTEKIRKGEYHTSPTTECYLDKKTGNALTYEQAKARNFVEVRKIYVMTKLDRVVWNALYQVYYKFFSHLIHPLCCSYKKGESTRKVVRRVSADFKEMKDYNGSKDDVVKFFDSVALPVIDGTMDMLEKEEPSCVHYVVREFYHDNRIIVNGEEIEKYCSLKQGCAMSAFFADLVIRDIDEYMSHQLVTYYRYSDDCIIVGEKTSASKARFKMEQMLNEKGLRFNPKKCEAINKKRWVTFLGFKIKNTTITVSKEVLDNITHKIKEETIFKCKKLHRALTEKELRRAIDNIQYWLFVGTKDTEAGMGAYLFGAINEMHDLELIDIFAKDCIRAAYTNKCDIYGLVASYGEHGVMAGGNDKNGVYHPGRNVGMNKLKTEGLPERLGWYSLIHMYKKYHSGTDVYKAEVLRMRNGECFEGDEK